MEQFEPKRLPKGKVITHHKCKAIFKIVYTGSTIRCEKCGEKLVLKHTEDPNVYLGVPADSTADADTVTRPGATLSSQELSDKVALKSTFSSSIDTSSLTEKTEIYTRASRITSPSLSPSSEHTEAVTTKIFKKGADAGKKISKKTGSFVGSLILFFFYLVMSNGLDGEMHYANSVTYRSPAAQVVSASNAGVLPSSTIVKAVKELRSKEERDKPAIQTIEKISLPPAKRISSGFGYRVHPITHRWRFHTGIDIPAKMGSPVKAALSGRVIAVGYEKGYGNYVVLEHTDGYTTLYGHNKKNLVKVGQWVEQGQTIALVGSTGHATGPHIHFELRRFGKYLNPLKHKNLKLEKVYLEIL